MLQDVFQIIAKGNAVAFLGAGASADSISLGDTNPPTGRQLKNQLNQMAGTADLDLENAAQTLIDDKIKQKQLLDHLRSSFLINTASTGYYKLAGNHP